MLFNLLFFVLGLVFGSFVSAVSYRVVRDLQFTRGRSFCDNCKKDLSWWQNIPLFSYFFLQGKCRYCRRKISVRYPLIEVSCGIAFLTIYFFRLLLPYSYLFMIAIFTLLLIIFVTDLEHKIIPDEIVFFAIFFSVFYFLLSGPSQPIFSSIFSGFLSASILMFVNILTKGRGMGLGDVKFAVFGGFIVGSKLLLPWLFLSFLTGAVVAIILVLVKGARLKDKIAFGPFLIAALPLAFLFGDKLIRLLGF